MSFIQNTRRPKGLGGMIMLRKMNSGHHAELSEWGFEHMDLDGCSNILEIGCGGGANIANFLRKCPQSSVTGVDYSDASVKMSRRVNAEQIKAGRCRILKEDVRSLSFADNSFDMAAAFETIYFWTEITECFAQVCRVLKEGGKFFICNETDGDYEPDYEWEKNIEGLKIYKEEDIRKFLMDAGFSSVTSIRNEEKHWICYTAEK